MHSSGYISQSDSFGWLEPQQQEIAVRMLPVASECGSTLRSFRFRFQAEMLSEDVERITARLMQV
jgi:hypothetical protein